MPSGLHAPSSESEVLHGADVCRCRGCCRGHGRRCGVSGVGTRSSRGPDGRDLQAPAASPVRSGRGERLEPIPPPRTGGATASDVQSKTAPRRPRGTEVLGRSACLSGDARQALAHMHARGGRICALPPAARPSARTLRYRRRGRGTPPGGEGREESPSTVRATALSGGHQLLAMRTHRDSMRFLWAVKQHGIRRASQKGGCGTLTSEKVHTRPIQRVHRTAGTRTPPSSEVRVGRARMPIVRRLVVARIRLRLVWDRCAVPGSSLG